MFLGFERSDLRVVLRFLRMGLSDRYLGSRIGSLWAALNPLAMLTAFALVFGFVFRTRLPGSDSTFSYVVWLVAGYGPWLAFVDSVTASANSLVTNAGIVKNVAIKTELLPIAASLFGIVPLAVSLLVLVVLLYADGNPLSWHAISLVVVVPLLFALTAALGIVLAAITAFVRDLAYALPNLLMLLMLATPVLYPIGAVPGILQKAALANPLYLLAEAFRAPLIRHQWPEPWAILYLALLTLGLGVAALKLFRRMKGYFSAVM